MYELPKSATIEPVQPGVTYNIAGKPLSVIGMIKAPGTEKRVPLVDVPVMSDFKWQLEALRNRIKSPEQYEAIDSSVSDTIERLFNWCAEHLPQATPKEAAAFNNLLTIKAH